MHPISLRRLTFALCLIAPVVAAAQPVSAPFTTQVTKGALTLSHGSDRIEISFVTPNTLHAHAMPQDRSSPVSVVIDPAAKQFALTDVKTSTWEDRHYPVHGAGLAALGCCAPDSRRSPPASRVMPVRRWCGARPATARW